MVLLLATLPLRPELSGPVQTLVSDDGLFEVHWTDEGRDAAEPELAERALEGLELGASAFAERGYRPLIGDAGTGGSDAIDAYIREIDINGYAHPLDGSCFLELSDDLSLDGLMQSVAIHELQHCNAYRYTSETHGWAYEAAATYEQYLNYLDPNLELAVTVLYQRRLDGPHLALSHRDGEYEYAGFLFMQFWEQRGGSLPLLWEALEAEPKWFEGMETASREAFARGLDETYHEHMVWNFFVCAHDDGAHYDTSRLPCSEFVSVPFDVLAALPTAWEVTLDDKPYTTAYAELPGEADGVTVRCTVDGPALLTLVEVDAEGAAGAEATGRGDDELVVELPGPLDPLGTVRLIFSAKDPVHGSCDLAVAPAPVTPEEDGGCGCATGGSPGWWAVLVLLAARRR